MAAIRRKLYLRSCLAMLCMRQGDTVVTSGYSSVFPEGVPVGIVMDRVAEREENFRTLRIKLSTDFTTLSTVRVIVDDLADELRTVEDDGITERKTSMPRTSP